MNPNNFDDESDSLNRYKVQSRREVVQLLRKIRESRQLIQMQARNGQDAAVTSLLEVDEAAGAVILDCASDRRTNERLLQSDHIAFEAMLDNIRILFSSTHAVDCVHEGRPALQIDIPASLIRLQRREFYRVPTPVANPVRCTIPITDDSGTVVRKVELTLYNMGGGGLGVIDGEKQIEPALGKTFDNCRVDLPGAALNISLRLSNVQDVTLANGKNIRRIGFMYVDPSSAVEAAIQRYLTRLEREMNARKTGMG